MSEASDAKVMSSRGDKVILSSIADIANVGLGFHSVDVTTGLDQVFENLLKTSRPNEDSRIEGRCVSETMRSLKITGADGILPDQCAPRHVRCFFLIEEASNLPKVNGKHPNACLVVKTATQEVREILLLFVIVAKQIAYPCMTIGCTYRLPSLSLLLLLFLAMSSADTMIPWNRFGARPLPPMCIHYGTKFSPWSSRQRHAA
jgi:hypothetical protein